MSDKPDGDIIVCRKCGQTAQLGLLMPFFGEGDFDATVVCESCAATIHASEPLDSAAVEAAIQEHPGIADPMAWMRSLFGMPFGEKSHNGIDQHDGESGSAWSPGPNASATASATPSNSS